MPLQIPPLRIFIENVMEGNVGLPGDGIPRRTQDRCLRSGHSAMAINSITVENIEEGAHQAFNAGIPVISLVFFSFSKPFMMPLLTLFCRA